jgi:stress-induced morphogen
MAAPTDTQASATANESGITPESLEETLKSKLNASYVAIEDMSGGCGQAFNAIIVSSEFDKKTHLQRHRLVNNALKAEIAAIHAWTPRCLTPEQWDKEQGK